MPIPHNLEMYQDLYPDLEIIQWSDIYKGMKFHKPRPTMLLDGGEVIPYKSKVVGDTATSESILRLVVFDRDYVIAKLATDNQELGKHLTCEQFTQLMGFVYDKIQGY